ncbi:hypothetical protein DdX_12627 [Ditylenchus destructor]|uniref:Uncharacterized protein n=1 Tax=Ditylenchus destructor TaxID=166010 RepID=A0AAD4N007_9BILA|nr:hypothetical protein DdX_12627 [Ditylenchus destructor]
MFAAFKALHSASELRERTKAWIWGWPGFWLSFMADRGESVEEGSGEGRDGRQRQGGKKRREKAGWKAGKLRNESSN